MRSIKAECPKRMAGRLLVGRDHERKLHEARKEEAGSNDGGPGLVASDRGFNFGWGLF